MLIMFQIDMEIHIFKYLQDFISKIIYKTLKKSPLLDVYPPKYAFSKEYAPLPPPPLIPHKITLF